MRAYAASAKGGLWYTGDAGATWAPVGGWATRSVNPQGNGNLASGGALLVDFSGGLAALDVVLFGTGEPTPVTTATGSSAQGGMGVLAALGPTFDPVDADPWEPDTGAALLAGLGVWRLVRHPSATAFSTTPGATQDRVLAATTNGLYLGTRSSLPHVPAAPPSAPGMPAQPELPARDGFTWASCSAAPPLAANGVTDVVWLANGPATRIVYALSRRGVFVSDDSGATGVPIVGLQFPGVRFLNRISLTVVPGTSRMYVLAEVRVGGVPTPSLFRIVDALASPPVVVPVAGVPRNLFGDPTKPSTQGWYDHGLAAEAVGGNDRIYLGGSAVYPRNDAEGDWSGSLYCFETPAPPAAIAPLAAVNGVSRRGNPPAGDGADINGLIGNNVHADIHAIRLTGPAAPNRQVWVGCDGGVYVSEHSGRVNTFASAQQRARHARADLRRRPSQLEPLPRHRIPGQRHPGPGRRHRVGGDVQGRRRGHGLPPHPVRHHRHAVDQGGLERLAVERLLRSDHTPSRPGRGRSTGERRGGVLLRCRRGGRHGHDRSSRARHEPGLDHRQPRRTNAAAMAGAAVSTRDDGEGRPQG